VKKNRALGARFFSFAEVYFFPTLDMPAM